MENLESSLAALKAYAAQHSIPLVFGTVEEEGALPSVTFEGEPRRESSVEHADDGSAEGGAGERDGGEIGTFLDAIRALDVQALVVSVTRASEEDWEEARAAWAAAETELIDDYRDVLDDAKRALELRPTPVDDIAAITVAAVTTRPALIVSHSVLAPWHFAVMGYGTVLEHYREQSDDARLASEEAPLREARRRAEEEYQRREAEERLWSGSKRRATVTALATHPDFPKCKKEEARIFLLAKIIGEEHLPRDRAILRMMSREALAEYELEVKPTK